MIQFKEINPTKHQKILIAEVNYQQKEELFHYLKQKKVDLSELESFTNEKRKIEWMTIRGMLSMVLPEFCDIEYDNQRKPHLFNCSQHLSISHSHHKVAISIDEKATTGIDIQHISPKIIRIKEKFLNPLEISKITNFSAKYLSLYWSVKEALFKVYGKKDIFLKDNIQVDELKFDGQKGEANGIIKTASHFSKHQLELKLIDDYVLAYLVN